MPYDCTLQPGKIAKIPLGFGIGQFIITLVVIADFVTKLGEQRGVGAFGCTGKWQGKAASADTTGAAYTLNIGLKYRDVPRQRG